MATIESLIGDELFSILDQKKEDNFRLYLETNIKSDLAKTDYKEVFLDDWGITQSEVDVELEDAAGTMVEYFEMDDVYESEVKDMEYDDLKNTEFAKTEQEYQKIMNDKDKAFKTLNQEHISKTLVKYHLFQKILIEF